MSLYKNISEVPEGLEPTCEGCGYYVLEKHLCLASRTEKSCCQYIIMLMAKAKRIVKDV